MTESLERGVFEAALANKKTTVSVFPSQLCEDIDFSAMIGTDQSTAEQIRRIMETANDPDRFLFSLGELGNQERTTARTLLLSGKVAAVDGTDAMRPVTFMNTSAYACAVGYLTSQERGTPHISITTTNTEYLQQNTQSRYQQDELARLCDALDQCRIDRSWPTTFREYAERRVALECGAPVVFIDGPIWTQNLVTQPSGRALYADIEDSSQIFIGIIKDISGSWTLSKWCGYSLFPGEGFVCGSVRAQFLQRFRETSTVRNWIEQASSTYVRVVFRPAQKAFALECRLGDLPLAIALICEDASPTLHHELPLLLELIDAQVRGVFNGALAAEIVIARMQQVDFRMGVDLTNEREYR